MKRFSKRRANNPNQKTFDQYPEWLKEKIRNAEAAKKDYIADPQDSTKVAYQKFKANQTRKPSNGISLSAFQKTAEQTTTPKPNPDFSLFMKTGRHINVPFEVVKTHLAREAAKRGKEYVLTIGEALSAEIERQKRFGPTNTEDALHNLRFFINAKGKLRAEITQEEKAEIEAELARVKVLKKEHQQISLSPRALVAYETIKFIENFKRITGNEPEAQFAITHGIMNTLATLKRQSSK
jgi:hypothetical protein